MAYPVATAPAPVFRGVGAGAALIRPIPGARLTDTLGAARSGGRKHEGIDIFAPEGTPIHAVAGGTIVQGFTNGLGGNVVRVQGLTDGFESAAGTLEPAAQTGVPGGAALGPGGMGSGAGGLGTGGVGSDALAAGADPLSSGAPGGAALAGLAH